MVMASKLNKPHLQVVIILALLVGPLSITAQYRQDKRPAKDVISSVALVDQDGKRIDFYDDLLKGRVVAINFIYTTCAAICPMQGDQFARLQTQLGERLGKDVLLISISADPEADSAEKLKAWLTHFGAKKGWTFVTGEKSEIDRLSRALTGDEARKGNHSPFMFVGNYDRGLWKRVYGLAEPERLTSMLINLSAGHKGLQ